MDYGQNATAVAGIGQRQPKEQSLTGMLSVGESHANEIHDRLAKLVNHLDPRPIPSAPDNREQTDVPGAISAGRRMQSQMERSINLLSRLELLLV